MLVRELSYLYVFLRSILYSLEKEGKASVMASKVTRLTLPDLVLTQLGTLSASTNSSLTPGMVPQTASSSTRRDCSGMEGETGCLKGGWVCHSFA